jgi:hypothetical protein
VIGGARAFVLGAALVGAVAAGAWASAAPADPDFLRLHAAGALVAGGEGARLYDVALPAAGPEGKAAGLRRFRGTPATAVAAMPLGVLPERGAWIGWVALCGAAAAAGVALAATAASRPGARPGWIAAAAAIPAAPLLLAAVARGSLVVPLFVLAAGSLAALASGRDRAAGRLAGAAAALKLAPVILLLWFAWKRRTRAAAWGAVAAAALFFLLPLGFVGPSSGWSLLRRWSHLDDPLVTEVDERPGTTATVSVVNVEGQSAKAILYRLFGTTKWFRVRERPLEPGVASDPGHIAPRIAGPVPSRTLYAAWLGFSGLLLVTAVFATGPRREDDAESENARFPLEGGLVLAALPLVWPEAGEMHYALCVPVLAALAASLWIEAMAGRPAGPGPRGRAAQAQPSEPPGAPFPLRAGLAAAGALLLMLPAGGLLGRDLSEALLARGATGWGGLLLFGAAALTLFRLRAVPPGMGPAPRPVP